MKSLAVFAVLSLSILLAPGLQAAVELPASADVYVVNDTELQVRLGGNATVQEMPGAVSPRSKAADTDARFSGRDHGKALVYGAYEPGVRATPVFEFGVFYGLVDGCDGEGRCTRVMACDLFVPNALRDEWVKVEDTWKHQRYISEKLGYAVDLEYVDIPSMARELYVTAAPLAVTPQTALRDKPKRASYPAR